MDFTNDFTSFQCVFMDFFGLCANASRPSLTISPFTDSHPNPFDLCKQHSSLNFLRHFHMCRPTTASAFSR